MDWLKGSDAQRPGMNEVYVTRLHLRYDAEHFPEDLLLQETRDKENFQGRYVLRHPWSGKPECEAAEVYLRELPKRREERIQNLSRLTGWPVERVRKKSGAYKPEPRKSPR